MKRRHWFHCTEKFHGQTWTAGRAIPNVPNEPPVPRLCVAENIVRCFAARLFQRQVFVYRTESKRRAVRPVKVNDSCLTGEHWLVPPVTMVHVDTVPEDIVREASFGVLERLSAKGWVSGLNLLEKMLCYREAAEVLTPRWCHARECVLVDELISWWEARLEKEKVTA